MFINIITLFPEMFRTITDYGVIGRAVKKNLLTFKFWNPRNFTCNQHHAIDDRPYGGGAGMLMMAHPLKKAITAAKKIAGEDVTVIYLSPQGMKLDQNSARKISTYQKIILVCGRYKGIDERVIQTEINEEWSIGDYVLSGGELASMVLIDSVARFIPGVLGHSNSVEVDSFSNGLLDCPHYTRPEISLGIKVPSILLSGNHDKIRRWRLKQSLGRTWLKRAILLKKMTLTNEQAELLVEFQQEHLSRKQYT